MGINTTQVAVKGQADCIGGGFGHSQAGSKDSVGA